MKVSEPMAIGMLTKLGIAVIFIASFSCLVFGSLMLCLLKHFIRFEMKWTQLDDLDTLSIMQG